MENREETVQSNQETLQKETLPQKSRKKLLFIFVGVGIFSLVSVSLTLYFLHNKLLHIPLNSQSQKTIKQLVITPSQTPTIPLYKSPFGISFVNPIPNNIQEYDFSSFCSVMQNISQHKPSTTASSSATDISFPNNDYVTVPYLIAIKMDKVGTLPSQFCIPGDPTPYNFFYKDNVMFGEIQNLIEKKVQPSQTTYFNDQGMSKRFNVTYYKNDISHVFGITNLRLYGFVVPGLEIYREYFLHDPNSKMIIYIEAPIVCAQKDALEKQQNNKTFNGILYIQKLHDLALNCEKNSPAKKITDGIISTLQFNEQRSQH